MNRKFRAANFILGYLASGGQTPILGRIWTDLDESNLVKGFVLKKTFREALFFSVKVLASRKNEAQLLSSVTSNYRTVSVRCHSARVEEPDVAAQGRHLRAGHHHRQHPWHVISKRRAPRPKIAR